MLSGRSSVGRVSAFQADCREFESRRPLHKKPIDISSSVFCIMDFDIKYREFDILVGSFKFYLYNFILHYNNVFLNSISNYIFYSFLL